MKLTFSVILILTIFSLNSLANNDGWYNIKSLGAKTDGSEICTEIIQKAINDANNYGGGTIYFPSGTYLTGAIHLKSNIIIRLDAGALVKFSTNPDDYLPFVKVRWEGIVMNSFSPLLHANQVENITIEGRGTFDGQGKKWWDTILAYIAQINENGDIDSIDHYQKMWMEANKNIEASDYYRRTLKRRFFRPPFFQAYKSSNIRIAGVKFINSPFWTINPVFCDNITIDGITINNPPSPNTDGINPSSCSNVRIANCHITVGDDCITIKSGRDAQARNINIPCQNITITNCTMLRGHGGVVIGSEVSGSVRKVTISNCIFDGTDRGIRLKSSRERGGTVEEIRVSNVVMNDIQREAFMFNLMYDKHLKEEPVNEKTPCFKNIHISNVTGNKVKQACKIVGINEMPIQNLSFSNINIDSKLGFEVHTAENIEFHDVTVNSEDGSAFKVAQSSDIIFDNVKTNKPLEDSPVILFDNVKNTYILNSVQLKETNTFLKVQGEESNNINLLNNSLNNVRKVVDAPKSLNKNIIIK